MGEAKRRKLAGTYPDPSPRRPFLARYDSGEGTLSFEAAVDQARSEKAGAYAFVPERRGSTIIGGEVWVIAYDVNHESKPDEYDEICVYHLTSTFGSDFAEDDWYALGDVAEEIQGLRFRPTRLDPHTIAFLDLGVALRMLEGQSRADALSAAGF